MTHVEGRCRDNHGSLTKFRDGSPKISEHVRAVICGCPEVVFAVTVLIFVFTAMLRDIKGLARNSPHFISREPQGLVNVPFWGYWTSPYSSHCRHL